MKNLVRATLLLFTLSLVMVSCSKDDCTNLAETVIGSWTTVGSDIEFQTGGLLIDANDILGGGELGGAVLDEKSWSLSGDTLLMVRAANGSQFLEFSHMITSFECDKISLSTFGIDFEMIRR